jgi:hypothetical protein
MRLAPLSVRATAVLLATVMAGCHIGNGPVVLRDFQRSPPGERASDDFWADAAAWAESSKSPESSSFDVKLWLLPGWVSGRTTSLGPRAESVSDTQLQFFNPGLLFLPLIPLWLHADTQLEQRSGGRSHNVLTWTPLWASSRAEDWPSDVPRASAWGLPLVYGQVEYGREDEAPAFEVHNLFWTLGPAWSRIDLPDEELNAHGWGACPLLLGGPGAWLWTSAHVQTPEADSTVHGALNGWIGYRSVDDLDEQVFRRHVLAGALWYDVEESAGDTVIDSRHGPLWGAFGWGRSAGEPALYLLWFPIEL